MHHFQSIGSDEEMDSDDTEKDPTYMQSEGEDDGSSFEEECSSSDESKVIIRITMHMDDVACLQCFLLKYIHVSLLSVIELQFHKFTQGKSKSKIHA